MTRSRMSAWVLVALLATVAWGGEDYLGSEALHEAGLTKYWQMQLPLESGQRIADTFLVDDQIYATTNDGFLYAVDARTGVVRWLQPVTRSGYRIFRPGHAGPWVLVVTPVDIQVYDKESGMPRAFDGRRRLRFPPSTGPVFNGGYVFVGGIDERLYAFDLETLFVAWQVQVDGPISSQPLLINERVIVANDGGTVYACTQVDKRLAWGAVTYGPVTADLVGSPELGVFVASRDQSLYLLDVAYGRVRWQARFGSPLYDAPYLSNDLAYQFSQVDGLVGVEMGLEHEVDERARWKLKAGRAALATDDESVYVRSRSGDLLVVDQADGSVKHTVPVEGFRFHMPVEGHAVVLLGDEDGRLYCARRAGTPTLTRGDIREAFMPPEDEAGAEEAAVALPEVGEEEPKQAEDRLTSPRAGVPIGGKSKVTRALEQQKAGQ